MSRYISARSRVSNYFWYRVFSLPVYVDSALSTYLFSAINLPPAADRSGDDGRDVYYRSFLI